MEDCDTSVDLDVESHISLEASSSCKFSSENWKILNDLRKEKKKLELFEASTVTSAEETLSNLSLDGKDAISPISSAHTLSQQHDISIEGKYKNEDFSSLDISNEDGTKEDKIGQSSSHQSDSSNSLSSNRKLKIDNQTRSFSPSDYIKSTTDIMEGTTVKVERYCRPSLLLSQNVDEDHSEKNSTSSNGPDDEMTKPLENLPPISPLMISMLQCIFSLPKFRVFLSNFISEKIDNIKNYPTLNFLAERYSLYKNGSPWCITSENESFTDQSLGLLLLSTIEIFHEELSQAKMDGVLNNVCFKDCRHIMKRNHTVISHLFRGQFTRKVICSCGYKGVLKNAFTDIMVSWEDIYQKSIIINSVQKVSDRLAIIRVLVDITDQTNISDVLKIVNKTMNEQNKETIKTDLCFYSLHDSGLMEIPDVNERMFNMLRHNDIELFICNTTLGDSTSSELLSHSINTVSTMESDKKNIMVSTPANSTIFSIGNETTLSIPEIKRSSNVSAVVNVKLYTMKGLNKDEILTLALRFPKICHGLYVLERFQNIIYGKSIKGSSDSKFSVFVFNKGGLCAFCLHSVCSGCPIQLSDRIIVSQGYRMSILITDDTDIQGVDIRNHESIDNNLPINYITLDESIRRYSLKNEGACPSCYDSLSWKQSQLTMRKYPDVLIIQFPSKLESTLLYPSDHFIPSITKSKVKRHYKLQCVKTYDENGCVYIRENNESWYLSYGNIKEVISKPPADDVELLIYFRVHEKMSCRATQRKINQRIANKFNLSKRKGDRKFHLSDKEYTSDFDSFMTNGSFSRTTMMTDQESLCSCQQCLSFGKLYHQLVRTRSKNSTVNEANNSSVQTDIVQRDRNITTSSYQVLSAEKKLHKAIRDQNFKDAVKFLNDGADVNEILNGSTALHLVAGMCPPFGGVFTELMIQHGADQSIRSSEGQTPIHVAVIWGREETLKILMKHGGQPHVKDHEGKSAFDYLLNKENKDCETLLRILRSEDRRNEENENDKMKKNNDVYIEVNGDVDDGEFLNVSDTSFKQTIGEKTFDDLFLQNPTTNCDVKMTSNENQLDESIISQHFSGDDSNITFDGSTKNNWMSLLLCAGKCSKLRRRRRERRYISAVARERVMEMLNNMRERIS